jgi:putative IMPACT (imprinted ancient) family translation regulator
MDAQALEEMEALAAIYDEDCEVYIEMRTVHAYLPSKSSIPHLVVVAHLHSDYPAHAPPLIELHAPPHVSDDMMAAASRQLEVLFIPGEVVLFRYIEWLKEQPQLYTVNALKASGVGALDEENHLPVDACCPLTKEMEAMEDNCHCAGSAVPAVQVQRTRSSGGTDSDMMVTMSQRIKSGMPVTVKKSTFQAHLASVNSVDEVKTVMDALLKVNKIANATHNIMAYRIHLQEKQSFLQDRDDDGESAAGGRLLHLLQAADVRNVVVVVSRWFGGVLLGPSRFSYINNTARQLLEEQGYLRRNVGVSKTTNVFTANKCK